MCPNCGAEVRDDWTLCPSCRMDMQKAADILGRDYYVPPESEPLFTKEALLRRRETATQPQAPSPGKNPGRNNPPGGMVSKGLPFIAKLIIGIVAIFIFIGIAGTIFDTPQTQKSISGGAVNIVYTTADTLYNQGKYQEAIAEYSKLTTANPQDNYSRAQIGMAYYNLGDYQNSVDALQKAVDVAPKDSISWYNLALSLHYLNRPEDALNALNEATVLNPTFEAAWGNKGCVLIDLHRYGEAIGAFDRALILNPNDESAKENRQIATKYMK